MKTWIQCWSGGKFSPLNPQAEEIHIEDIAHAESNICRYTGQGRWYSVAEHSIHLATYCLIYHDIYKAQCALLHDAAEAYVGDLNAPTKHQLELEAYRKAERKIQDVINDAFRVDDAEVRDYDIRIRNNEVPWVFPRRSKHWELTEGKSEDKEPLPGVQLYGWSPEVAEAKFLEFYRRLFK